jgi:hypothetical protein
LKSPAFVSEVLPMRGLPTMPTGTRNTLTDRRFDMSKLTLTALAVAVFSTFVVVAAQAEPTDCATVGAEIARSEEAKRVALEQKQDAWKVVVPFAVVARYAKGKAASSDADKRLAELNAQYARQGCARHGR